jgi:hypothetical protein
VDIFFQKSPGRPGDVRGIKALDFQVEKDGTVIQKGTTGADGRIRMRIQGGVSTLQLPVGKNFAKYTVSIRDEPIEAVSTPSGQQRRLRMLGYQIGQTGPDNNGVNGQEVPNARMNRSILEFQADDGKLRMDSVAGSNTQNALTTAARA